MLPFSTTTMDLKSKFCLSGLQKCAFYFLQWQPFLAEGPQFACQSSWTSNSKVDRCPVMVPPFHCYVTIKSFVHANHELKRKRKYTWDVVLVRYEVFTLWRVFRQGAVPAAGGCQLVERQRADPGPLLGRRHRVVHQEPPQPSGQVLRVVRTLAQSHGRTPRRIPEPGGTSSCCFAV